jgi:type IV secretion system protein TrbL
MNDTGVIDRFLETFTSYIDSGFGLLGGEVAFLTTTLIIIDITLAGLFWAWGADEDVLQRLIRKTLYIGFFAFIIGNFNSLANIVFESFSGLGLQAGGGSLSGSELLQPGRVAQVGIDAGNPILEAAGELMGYISFFENFVQIMVLMTAWAIVLIAFFILAVQIFVTLIEFKLTTLAGFVLIPFALFNKTAFLAEKVLGNIVASGVKILVLAVIVGIGSGARARDLQLSAPPRQVWDERIGSARVQAKNWRLMAFGSLALSAGFAAALVWQSARGTVVPWVVQVDKASARRRPSRRPSPTIARPIRRSPSISPASSSRSARFRPIRSSCGRTGCAPTTSRPIAARWRSTTMPAPTTPSPRSASSRSPSTSPASSARRRTASASPGPSAATRTASSPRPSAGPRSSPSSSSRRATPTAEGESARHLRQRHQLVEGAWAMTARKAGNPASRTSRTRGSP